MKFKGIAFVVVLIGGWCSGQNQTRVPSTNIPDAEYPKLDADLSATFRVQADNAQKVKLLMELGQSIHDMIKGASDFWEVRTKPLLPGFHYYAVSVDSFSSNDPGSRVFVAARREVSGLEVPSPDSEFFAVNNVPHGTVRTEWYFSKTTGQTRRILVYTPPGYEQSSARYPVLYLQHGFGEDEVGWSDQGHENFILDNLIAAQKATPMIIVNENGMTGVHFQPPPAPRPNAGPNEPPPPRPVSHFFMDERYEVLDKSKDYDGVLADPAKINQQLHLLWIGIGTDDFLLTSVRQSHELLEKAGIRHVCERFRSSRLDRLAQVPCRLCTKALSVVAR